MHINTMKLLDALDGVIGDIQASVNPAVEGKIRIADLMSRWLRHSQRIEYLEAFYAEGVALLNRITPTADAGSPMNKANPDQFEDFETQLRDLFIRIQQAVSVVLEHGATATEAEALLPALAEWEYRYYADRSAPPRPSPDGFGGKPTLANIATLSAENHPPSASPSQRQRVLTPDFLRLTRALDRSLAEAEALNTDRSVRDSLAIARSLAKLIDQGGGGPRSLAPEATSPGPPINLDPETLQAYFRRAVPGAEAVTVISTRRLSGGYGRATMLVEFDRPVMGQHELVIRAQLPDAIVIFDGVDIQAEYQVFRLAHAAGIAAPEPLILEDGENETGTKFLVVRKMPGSNYGSVFSVDRELSETLVHNIVQGLAQIHSVDIAGHKDIADACHLAKWAEDVTSTDSVRRWLDMWREFWDRFDYPSPLLERGFRWLYTHTPKRDAKPALLHSDYALGNLLIENDQISAVLDWEQTHLGDPAEEVAWLIVNLRSVVPEDRIVKIYGDLTGDYIKDERLRFFDVFTAVKVMLCGVAAVSKFQAKESLDGLFCELASFTIAPYAKILHEAIEHADHAR